MGAKKRHKPKLAPCKKIPRRSNYRADTPGASLPLIFMAKPPNTRMFINICTSSFPLKFYLNMVAQHNSFVKTEFIKKEEILQFASVSFLFPQIVLFLSKWFTISPIHNPYYSKSYSHFPQVFPQGSLNFYPCQNQSPSVELQ